MFVQSYARSDGPENASGGSRISEKRGYPRAPRLWQMATHEQTYSSWPKLCHFFVKIVTLPIFYPNNKKLRKRKNLTESHGSHVTESQNRCRECDCTKRQTISLLFICTASNSREFEPLKPPPLPLYSPRAALTLRFFPSFSNTITTTTTIWSRSVKRDDSVHGKQRQCTL